MEKSNQSEASSPLATVEQIQKRLARPASLRSQISSSHAFSSQLSNRRLEDYLHPLVLSTVRAKIGGKRKLVEEMLKETKKNEELEWFDELRDISGGLKAEKKRMKRNRVVDLKCDSDSIYTGGGGGGEDGSDEEVECTPFRRFEETALKRFRG